MRKFAVSVTQMEVAELHLHDGDKYLGFVDMCSLDDARRVEKFIKKIIKSKAKFKKRRGDK